MAEPAILNRMDAVLQYAGTETRASHKDVPQLIESALPEALLRRAARVGC